MFEQHASMKAQKKFENFVEKQEQGQGMERKWKRKEKKRKEK